MISLTASGKSVESDWEFDITRWKPVKKFPGFVGLKPQNQQNQRGQRALGGPSSERFWSRPKPGLRSRVTRLVRCFHWQYGRIRVSFSLAPLFSHSQCILTILLNSSRLRIRSRDWTPSWLSPWCPWLPTHQVQERVVHVFGHYADIPLTEFIYKAEVC
jgi:hypothetical protein